MSGPPVPVLLLLIRARAKAQGMSVRSFAKAAGIPYSRAHSLLVTGTGDRVRHLEAAISTLCPDLWRRLVRELSQ